MAGGDMIFMIRRGQASVELSGAGPRLCLRWGSPAWRPGSVSRWRAILARRLRVTSKELAREITLPDRREK
jgi:hypothetical protein